MHHEQHMSIIHKNLEPQVKQVTEPTGLEVHHHAQMVVHLKLTWCISDTRVPQYHRLGHTHAAEDTQPKLCIDTADPESMSEHYQQGRSTEVTWVKDQLHVLRLGA